MPAPDITPNDVAQVAQALPASWINIAFFFAVTIGMVVIYGRKFLKALQDGIDIPVAPAADLTPVNDLVKQVDLLVIQQMKTAVALEGLVTAQIDICKAIHAHLEALAQDREKRADEEAIQQLLDKELDKRLAARRRRSTSRRKPTET